MLLQLLHPELEMIVISGYVYVPLLFDPDIAREIQDAFGPHGSPNQRVLAKSKSVVELAGRQFIKSVSIQSLLASYESIDKVDYEQLKKDHLGKPADFQLLEVISPGSKIQTIIFGIMPYFIRKSRGLERRRLSDEELLDLVAGKIDVPQSFMKLADELLDPGPLLRRLRDLEKQDPFVEPLQESPVTGEEFRQWFHKALAAHIVNREIARIKREIGERERCGESKRNHMATLLYIADNGSFELDGFGFSRIGSRDDYLIYKRTGEYILKDYYARSYLFPDCRVAVSTSGPLRPLVLELYKHPFLFGYAPEQEICIKGYDWPDRFTADNIIRLLEEGINALLYGYDARRRNGYHSLDPTLYYVKTIEFEDYRVRSHDSQSISL